MRSAPDDGSNRSGDRATIRRGPAVLALTLIAVLVGFGCRGGEKELGEGTAERGAEPTLPGGPSEGAPNALPDVVEALREDMNAPRHPSDGSGSARVDEGDGTPGATVGEPSRWTVVWTAGEEGLEPGAWVFFQVSPFWGWSPPQLTDPSAPGYTEVSASRGDLTLAPAILDRGLVGVELEAGLGPGDEVRFVYGAGEAGAFPDTYAERESPFWIAVDGDGDGVRGLVLPAPTVEVSPGPPSRLSLVLPSTSRPGETVELVVALLDDRGNACFGADPHDLSLTKEGDGDAVIPPVIRIDGGTARVPVRVTGEGVVRIAGEVSGMTGESNPLVSEEGWPRILWGDLHGHSALSDGTGAPEDYFRYARDVAGLDVVSLTDHDHWGMRAVARSPELWERILAAGEAANDEGAFVTLPGFEWTNWIYGHRHVLYFGGEPAIFSSVDRDWDHPEELWRALRGRDALTVAHHSAGGPVAIDWSIAPDPELEPVTEVVSVHGSSEAADSPGLIYGALRGNFVRDALDRGYRLGFVGSGDSHDGHPGLAHLEAPTGGLAALVGAERNRASVKAALRARRTYATSGPRIALRADLGGLRPGSEVPARDLPPETSYSVETITPSAIDRIDLVRSGRVVASSDCGGERRCRAGFPVPDPKSGEYLYARVVQIDGGTAWASPVFVVEGMRREE